LPTDPIRARQIKLIHVLVHAIGMDDDTYRVMLGQFRAATGKPAESSKDLTRDQRDVLLKRLEYVGEKIGRWQVRRDNRTKYDELGYRPGMAAPSKLRKIEGMWKDVSYQKTTSDRERALRALLMRLYGVSDLRFLTDEQANKMLKTVSAMKKGKIAHHRSDRSDRSDQSDHGQGKEKA
jgi:hypothetical protein